MRSSTKTLMWLPVTTVVLTGFGGCASPDDTYSVASKIAFLQEWTQRLDYMGFVPILPAIEDLRVGDMYVYSVNPMKLKSAQDKRAAAREIAATTRWGSLPVLSELAEEYQQRPPWPKTPDEYLGSMSVGRTAVWEEPQASGGRSIFNPQETTTRLPSVGLENFTTVSFAGSNLETIIPTEVATLVTGSATPDTLSVTLRAGSGESYALSMAQVISVLAEPAPPAPATTPAVPDEADAGRPAAPAPPPPRYRVRQPYRDHLDFVGGPGHDRVWLHVVTEVVYMRSADVTIRVKQETYKDDKVTAPELERDAPKAAPASAEPKPQPSPDEAVPAQSELAAVEDEAATDPKVRQGLATYVATQLDPIYGAFVRAEAINRKLEEMAMANLPNGSVRFLAVTDESMALRRVWPRGLAIGVKGLFLEVDVATGNILGGGPMRWPVSLSMGK